MTDARTPIDPVGVERDPRPIVAAPRRGAPGAVIAAAGLLAAILLFVLLNAQRQQAQVVSEADRLPVVYAAPPPLRIPVEPAVRAQPVALAAVQPVTLAPPPAPPPPRQEPDEPPPPPPPIIRQYEPPPPPPMPIRQPPRPSGQDPSALVIDTGGGDLTYGTLIPAVLETPIDTSRPGQVRAIVSQDVSGHDGAKVLVPRGSRLIGEYQSDVRSGQNRVLVNWTRLVRPDGIAVRLGTPSADAMGAAGIPGRYHSFFFSRFLNATLQTALNVGGNLVGRNGNNTVVLGGSNTLGAAGQNLLPESPRPKITVKSGTLFNVFVNREIDFTGSTPAQ